MTRTGSCALLGPMKMTRIALGIGAVLAAIQLVPVARTNPPVEAQLALTAWARGLGAQRGK